MPKVPTYDSFQASPTTVPQQQYAAPVMPDVADKQLIATGEGLTKAGDAVSRIAADMQAQANKVLVDDASNQGVQAATNLKLEALSLKGKNALDRPDGVSLADEYSAKFQQQLDKIGEGLKNDAQKAAFQHIAGQLKNQMYATLGTHMLEQQKVYKLDTQKSTIATAQSQAVLLWGDAAMREQSANAIRNTIDDMARDNGWDDKTKEAELANAMGGMHAGIIKSMVQGGMAGEAQKYYDDNSASMSLQSRASVSEMLKSAVVFQKADAAVDEVWQSLGPKGVNDSVNIFDMEQAIRERFKGDQDATRAGIEGLRQRAQAINAQQAETKAQGVAGVWKLIDSGAGMAQVTRSDAWLSLSATDQHSIRKTLAEEASVRESRAAAKSARELSELQRNDHLNLLRNGDKYLTLTDPEVLSKMSRAQVEAKRGEFGFEATQHLLTKWDSLQKPGKVVEARFDTEDFNMTADALGLKPFAKDSSEDHKRALGTLKYRIEQVIDMKQAELKRPLARQEKQELMRQEMAKTVTINPGWFSFSKAVPVVQLTGDQVNQVVIPESDRKRITDAMSKKYATTKDRAFAPTEQNLRYWYLREKSPAANTITP